MRDDLSAAAAAVETRVVETLAAARQSGTITAADEAAFAGWAIGDALVAEARRRLEMGEVLLTEADENEIRWAVLARLWGMGPFTDLLGDDGVVNVKLNGERVFVDRTDGSVEEHPPLFSSDEDLIDFVRALARRVGLAERSWDAAHPWVNLQLPDGNRLFAIAWVCARPQVTIRRHRLWKVTLGDLVGLGTLPESLADYLGAAVGAGLNLVVAGPAGSGKTTMVRAVAGHIPPPERIVTIETDYELGLDRLPEAHHDVIALEARPASLEGVGEVTCADLVPRAMRLSTRWLIVGEVLRDEVVPMLEALNTGCRGMATLHASSSAEVFDRLALLGAQSPQRLEWATANRLAATALDVVVYLAAHERGPGGYVESVREVAGVDDSAQVLTNEIYTAVGGWAGVRSRFADRLRREGWG